MRERIANGVLWLFVIDLSIAAGAGLYESRFLVPQWASSPPSTWVQTGQTFWVYVTTVPLTLLTLASLVYAWKEQTARRSWWLAAALVIVVERIATFSYFIPTMYRLQTETGLSPSEVAQTLSTWASVNMLRHLATISGWLLALKALSLPATNPRYQHEPRTAVLNN